MAKGVEDVEVREGREDEACDDNLDRVTRCARGEGAQNCAHV